MRAVPAEEPNVVPSLESSVSPAEPASMDTDEPTDVPNGLELGFPPRSIPRHGPGYLALSVEKRRNWYHCTTIWDILKLLCLQSF